MNYLALASWLRQAGFGKLASASSATGSWISNE